MEKLIRDGQVAVIIGSGYGEEWSSHASGEEKERAMYCPRLALAILGESDEDVGSVVDELFPDLRPYSGPNLMIEWVPVGVRFFIHEEEGNETIWREDEISWHTA